MDIDVSLLDRLEQEHRNVEAIFGRMDGATDESEQRSLFQELETALTPHMQTEESQVYPVLAEVDEEMAAEAENEHGEARDALAALKGQIGMPGFNAALETLKSGIEHHVEEEEGQTFPKLRQAAGS
ncbi:MAG TPA: hemerythrin domain-containing protein [Ilumatobacter sp.]|nr:hemerythrin domain-containing protein [Ilumatobacter sp.]